MAPLPSICPPLSDPGSACLEVFDRELNYIFGTLRRLGAPRSDVDDLIQDVFVALYTNWQTIDTSRPIRPWLFGVAFRVVRTRRRMRAREIPIENLDSIDEADGAEGQLQGFEATVLLKAALERVPSERRSVVVMHDLDGIEIIDIARQLSMTKFGVYARLYKGRKELASALRQMWKGRGSK